MPRLLAVVAGASFSRLLTLCYAKVHGCVTIARHGGGRDCWLVYMATSAALCSSDAFCQECSCLEGLWVLHEYLLTHRWC